MKQLFTLLLSVSLSVISYAQTDVYFKINHCLGANPFALNTKAINNISNEFEVTRLEYYISEINITHDGGQDTTIADKWILVDASSTTEELLGNLNITNIEEVQFSVGVNAAVNHLDPAQYPAGHPLALKWPSMHWGWSSGYRFVAIEGNAGNNMSQLFQIHALGDNNYFTTQIVTQGKDTLDSSLVIELFGDYEMAVNDIDIGTGLIYHGEFEEGIDLLENFRDSVFSTEKKIDTSTNVGIFEYGMNAIEFQISPNPVSSGQQIKFQDISEIDLVVIVSDLSGRIVYQNSLPTDKLIDPRIEQPGIYMVKLYNENSLMGIKKLVVTR